MGDLDYLPSATTEVATDHHSAGILAPPEEVSTVPAVSTGLRQDVSGRWVATHRVKMPDGKLKRRQKTFDTEEEARAWRAEQLGVKAGTRLVQGSNITQTKAGTYKVEVRRGKVRRTATFPTQEMAEQWRDECHRALDAGMDLPDPEFLKQRVLASPPPAPRLLGEVLQAWFDDNYTHRLAQGTVDPITVRTMVRHLDRAIRHLGALELNKVTHEDCRELVENLAKKGYAESTQRSCLWVIECSYGFAAARGWTNINPAHKVRTRPPEPGVDPKKSKNPLPNRDNRGRTVKMNHASLQLMHTMTASMSPQKALAAWLGRLMGLRLAEIYGLLLEDVDLERGLLRIAGQGGRPMWERTEDGTWKKVDAIRRTKGRITDGVPASTRTLAIPDCLRPLLEAEVNARSADGAEPADRLFPQGNTALSRALMMTSLTFFEDGRYVRPHDLRKSCTTDLQLRGVNGRLVSLWMGHKVGATDGQAAVTAGTYTNLSSVDANAYIKAVRKVAAVVDDMVNEELEGTLLHEPQETDTWLSVQEAAEILGTGTRVVYDLVGEGVVEARRVLVPGAHGGKQWRINPDDIVKWRDRAQFSLNAVALRLGQHPRNVRRMAEAHGIPPQRNPGGPGSTNAQYLLTEEAVHRLEEVYEDRARFQREHLNTDQAVRELGITRARFRNLVGVAIQPLPDAEAPFRPYARLDKPRAQWFRRSDVKALAKKLKKR